MDVGSQGRARSHLTLHGANGGSAAPLQGSALPLPETAPAAPGTTERLAVLELRLAELEETAELRDTELSAMERDLALKERYIAYLELERHLIGVELGQVRDRAAELFGDLERAEARVAELGAMVADIRSQPTYQLSQLLARVVRRLGPLEGLLRRLAGRSLAGRSLAR